MRIALTVPVNMHPSLELIQLIFDLLCQRRRQLVTCGNVGMSVVLVSIIGIVKNDSGRKTNTSLWRKSNLGRAHGRLFDAGNERCQQPWA